LRGERGQKNSDKLARGKEDTRDKQFFGLTTRMVDVVVHGGLQLSRALHAA